MQNINIMIIEDDLNYARSLKRMLSYKPVGILPEAGLKILNFGTLNKALKFLKSNNVDIILLDLFLPDSKGINTLEKVNSIMPNIPIIVLTGMIDDVNTAVSFIEKGAQDFLMKNDINVNLLFRSIMYAVERKKIFVELEDYLKKYQSSEANLRNLIENHADAIIVVGQDGIVLYINPAAEMLFGKSKKELIGSLFGFPIVTGNKTEISIIKKNNNTVGDMRVVKLLWEGEQSYLASIRDVTQQKKAESERERLIKELEESLKKIKTLSGFIPICAWCKNIRDDQGYWNNLEKYIEEHSLAEFTHSICPKCQEKLAESNKKIKGD